MPLLLLQMDRVMHIAGFYTEREIVTYCVILIVVLTTKSSVGAS